MMENSLSRHLSALIITSLEVEYKAIHEYLSDLHEDVFLQGATHERGIFKVPGYEWDITTLTTSPDNVNATFETERAIKYLRPEIVLFVGIAGGLKDVRIGDVVVATKIYSYEQIRKEDSFHTRPEIATTSYTLLKRALQEARNEDWLLRLAKHSTEDPQDSEHRPLVILAPIVAGEKGITTPSHLYNILRSNYSDAVAIEMEGEGYGFLSAVRANLSLQFLIIRGITELLEDKNRADKYRAWTAARRASAFAFQLLAGLGSALQSRLSMANSMQSQVYSNTPQTPSFPLAKGNAPEPLEIFFAYAEEDEKFVQRLQSYLSILKRTNVITSWHSGSTAGSEPLSEQIQHVNTASIILLIVSPDFLCSDYLFKIAERAMEKQRADGVTVIPILLRPTDGWRDTLFGNLRAIPRGDRPVASFNNLDLAIEQITNEIRTAAEKVKVTRS